MDETYENTIVLFLDFTIDKSFAIESGVNITPY